ERSQCDYWGISGRICASDQFGEQFLCGGGIFASVESGTAQGFHVDEDDGIGMEDSDGVCSEISRVVFFRASEVPIVARPGNRSGITDNEGMTDERWTSECRAGEEEQGEQDCKH